MDGDGDVDVFAAAIYGDEISWWENDGSENFAEQTIEENYDGACSVYATDVDGDGDVDVLAAAIVADDISWWEQGAPLEVVFVPAVSKNAGPPSSPPILYDIHNPDYHYNFTVSWSAVSGAASYTLEEDDNDAFSSPTAVYSGSGLSTSVFVGDVGTYYYRVNASNKFGSSNWSNSVSVKVKVPPPPCAQPGSWEGNASFTVPSGQSRVLDFELQIRTALCGNWTVTAPELPIDNCEIAFSAEDGASIGGSGTFVSLTEIEGDFTVFTGSALCWGSWDSSWVSSAAED
jgi:hypothetical protein